VDDRQLRAVIRVALRANGFDVRIGELAAADRRKLTLGLRLRDLLAQNLPGFADPADIARLADEDSVLWHRLPGMLAFGYQQGAVFRRLIHPDRRGLPVASLMPVAAFSAGISVLDYAADVLGLAEPIFDVLDEATVAALFSSGPEAEARLRRGYRESGDVRLRLLFALVGTCAAGIRRLHRRHGDDEGRHDLLATFGLLHAAQRAVTLPSAGTPDAVSTKSVLPFVAAHQIVELFDPPGTAKRAGRELARQLGHAIAVTDDVTDLLADWRSGAPNTLTQDREPGSRLTDAWLYQVAGQAAARIVSTLRAAALLHPSGRPTAARASAIEAAAKFATLTIARWVGWREELSAPSVLCSPRPRPEPATLRSCADAVGTLLEQQRTGYREAIHWMTVPRLGEDGVRLELHPALLFPRAIVLDSLLDAFAAGLDIPPSVLAHEALWLLRAKRADVRGGWSYLSAVPELPPDVDDLAMVLQALSRCGGPALADAGQYALRLVLAAAERGEAITTWILDPEDAPHRNELFRRYIELTESGGVHPEVVANLLYAASLPGMGKARQQAVSAIASLESAQDDDGSWPSRWYWGPLYGTYRAVLALTSAAPDSPALGRARDYLLAGQNPDGGWGADSGSDPLPTALAVLALAALAPASTRRLRKAVGYLLSAQQPDGSWPGSPFIAFPRVGGPGMHIYHSSTITTCFCLKAILAARVRRPRGNPAAQAVPPAPAWPTAADWS
jgi:hypothetical protein